MNYSQYLLIAIIFFFPLFIYGKSQFTFPPMKEDIITSDNSDVIKNSSNKNNDVKKLFYIIVASTKNIEIAKKVINKYLNLGYTVSIYKTRNNIYGVTLGVFERKMAKSIKKDLIKKNIIDSSSYISTGNNFVKKIIPLPSENTIKYSKYAMLYDPPSNIRKKPNGNIICTLDAKKNIKIQRIPVLGNKEQSWFKTNECGKFGYINSSQIRLNFDKNSLPNKERINFIRKSNKTKTYNGVWKKISVNVYIYWNSYTNNGGNLEGIIESENKIIESFTGHNYSFRKIKIVLNTGEIMNLKAKVDKSFKIWSTSNIKFQRKYK